MKPPVARLAPSPTGILHVGNARSLMWAWLSARARKGRVYLRVEDLLPGAREHVASVLEDLVWLGLDWDPPPELSPGRASCGDFSDIAADRADFVMQSQRTDLYRGLLARLNEAGLVYPCVCTRKDIALASRAPHVEDKARAYPGTCRGRFTDEGQAFRWETARSLRQGRSPSGVALRMKAPHEGVSFRDEFRGTMRIDVATDSGDFVIRKKDQHFAYMFAVVVDDLEMGVTEVLRGDDLLECTAQQLVVYRALIEHTSARSWPGKPAALQVPQWVHVPLVLGADGRRLAKRDRSIHVRQLADSGISAPQLRAWMAKSMGLPETGDLQQLLAAWPATTLNPEAVVFTADETLGA
ncbi:MAG TPA: tRNA glutamyl-Q(34) synthetase GluQRS [Myxococcales bacterium]|nr:tRNA glutamyl-Q(34) synthetase GluQRS [Myxococcales bacterium]HAN32009.1 tRNA glutamyl-Q(34) synthetase GluQRS [Myxococcales bacterium]